MEVYLLDDKFMQFHVIDTYQSLLWVERYQDCGEFELLMPATDEIIDILITAKYAEIKDSNETMIIENVELNTDVENGDTVKISGRSLLALLERRVLVQHLALKTHPITIAKLAFYKNVLSPDDPYRAINNFIDNLITPPMVDIPYNEEEFDFQGENILELIVMVCDMLHTGCKVVRNRKGERIDTMTASIYCGADRSYDQNKNMPVIFSPYFDNLLTSNYLESSKTLMNDCFVLDSGKDDNSNLVDAYFKASVDNKPIIPHGLNRREVFLKSDLEFASELDETATPAEKDAEKQAYISKLEQKGREELLTHRSTTVYDGELISSGQNEYGRDYFLGDIVSFRNAYGMESTVRITEVTRSYDTSGITLTPVFTSTKEEEV